MIAALYFSSPPQIHTKTNPMKTEDIQKTIKDLHKENQDLDDFRKNLNELFKFRSELKFDHPWLPEVNNTITNCQSLLQIKIHEKSNSLPSLIKRSLVTETLKFMVPFILGIAVAVYGLPSITAKNEMQSSSKKTSQQLPSQAPSTTQ